jgi:hypothetical protein
MTVFLCLGRSETDSSNTDTAPALSYNGLTADTKAPCVHPEVR